MRASNRLYGTIPMRNIIVGSIAMLLGSGAVVGVLLRGLPKAEGAYGAGALCGSIFGVVLFGAGLFALIQGIRSQGEDEEERPKPRRRKRRRRESEDD